MIEFLIYFIGFGISLLCFIKFDELAGLKFDYKTLFYAVIWPITWIILAVYAIYFAMQGSGRD